MLNQLKKELSRLENPEKAKILLKFFKTGKGQYGEGDIFLGITVPQQRQIAKEYSNLTLKDLQELISSRIHEYRLISLLILIIKYKNSKEEIFNFYLRNTKSINN